MSILSTALEYGMWTFKSGMWNWALGVRTSQWKPMEGLVLGGRISGSSAPVCIY
jgi:hypothetical protein